MSTLDKELALFAKYPDAPKEIKELGDLHYKNFEALEKVKLQMSTAQADLIRLERDYHMSGKEFRRALQEWMPKIVLSEEVPVKQGKK